MKKSVQNATQRRVTLTGTRPIMFDRYSGDNKTSLSTENKLYLSEGDPPIVGLPVVNVLSFLSAQNTESACKRFGGKRWRTAAASILSFVQIDAPDAIPFVANGKPIKFGGFNDKQFYIHKAVARLAKGIPNPKERPVLNLPWELSFGITILDNPDVDETFVLRLFELGGQSIGFGTYRGVYGKFDVTQWDSI